MSIDQIIQDLIPTLRYTLLNPTDQAKAEMLGEIEAVLGSAKVEPDRYWLNLIQGLTSRFTSKPTQALLRHLSKITGHYLVLVENGSVEVQRVARAAQFKPTSSTADWLRQEIEDRAYAFINRPTEETKRNLEVQLKSYLELVVR